MILHEMHDLSNKTALEILQKGLQEVDDPNIIQNYSPVYSHMSSNIFYILEHGRYNVGKYFVLENNGEYIASGGWNKYSEETALVMTRLYISKKNRTKYLFTERALPLMIDECSHFKNVWMTCNKYNKAIYDWFCRNEEGKHGSLFAGWPEIYKRFEPIGIKTVYHTEQYVVQLRK